MAEYNLDKLDHQIINALRNDGRLANTELGRRLGVSEATVRNRIQRLIGDGIIQVAAAANLSRLGYEVDVHVGIECRAGQVLDVARVLATMPEVRYVACIAGRFDIWTTVTLRSRAELFALLTERIGRIPGIERTETSAVLRVMKRDYDFWEFPPLEEDTGGMQPITGLLPETE